jgi:hypothetical protein
MFYTTKAGISANGVRKLKAAGITAVMVEDPKQINWPAPSDLDFSAVHDDLMLIILKSMVSTASNYAGMETFLGRNLLSAMQAAVAKKVPASNVAPIKKTS